jgi:hypothetical protein
MAESKYGKYILREPKGQGMPPRRPTQTSAITLTEELFSSFGKFDINFNFVGTLAPHVLGDPPHKHDVDELLFFIPTDPENASDLGGEVEIALGEEWEKQTITTAAIICLPAGVQHAPIYMKKVNRPFYFGHCLLAARYGSNATPAV